MKSVAVIGGGIVGCVSSLLAADAGFQVTLYERHASLWSGASSANEGKVHLGPIFALADSATHLLMIRAALSFSPIIERALGRSLEWSTLRADPFDYLVMSDSLLDAQSLSSVYESLNSLLPANATYLGDDLPLIMDPRSGVDDRTGMPVFRSLERSVDPVALGRTLVDAVRTHPGIIVREGSAVAALGGDDDGVRVTLEDDIVRHRFAINCAWDQRERLLPEGVARRPHNYRVKMSLRLAPVDGARTATLVQGPYGDVVAFPDYTYASWYPVGRLTNEYLDAPSPGAVAALAAARTDDDLGVRQIAALQSLSLLPDDIRVTEIMGGFILGHGAPDIDLVESGLHRRSEFGVRRHGSVVTPVSYKFGSGPLAASAAVAELSAAFG